MKSLTAAISSSSSSAEIEMYGLGEKVVPATCLGCNKTSCDFVPNCMDLIAAEMVEVAVIRPQATHGAQHTPEAPSV